MNIFASVDTITILNGSECEQTGSCHYRMEFSSWFSINMYNLSDYDFYRNIKDPAGNWHSTPGTLSECISSGICTEVESDHVDFVYTHLESGSVVVNMQVEDSWGGDYAAATLYHDVDIISTEIVCSSDKICYFEESDTVASAETHAVAQSGTTVYAGRENDIIVIDNTENTPAIHQITPVDGPVQSIIVNNSAMYVVAGNTLKSYDISNSLNPIVVAESSFDKLSNALFDSGILYVGTSDGLLILEMNGAVVANSTFLSTDTSILKIAKKDTKIIAVDAFSIKIIDVSTQLSPQLEQTEVIHGIKSMEITDSEIFIYRQYNENSEIKIMTYDMEETATIPIWCQEKNLFYRHENSVIFRCDSDSFIVDNSLNGDLLINHTSIGSIISASAPIVIEIPIDIGNINALCDGHGTEDPNTHECLCSAGYEHPYVYHWGMNAPQLNKRSCKKDHCYNESCSGHGFCNREHLWASNLYLGTIPTCNCEENYRWVRTSLSCTTASVGASVKKWFADKYNLSNASVLGVMHSSQDLPWPGHYYPHRDDSINIKWDGLLINNQMVYNLSATEKYIDVFTPEGDVEKQISETVGLLNTSLTNGIICSLDEDCIDDGFSCSNTPAYNGNKYCVYDDNASWFGICDRWTSAALKTKEPLRRVSCNTPDGETVLFEIDDIKALTTYTYLADSSLPTLDDFHHRFITFPEVPTLPIVSAINFHLALTNEIGVKQMGFAADVMGGPEVWNQPVFGYKIQSKTVVETTGDTTIYEYQTTMYYIVEPVALTSGYIEPVYRKKAFVPILRKAFPLIEDESLWNTPTTLLTLNQRIARALVNKQDVCYKLAVDKHGVFIDGEFCNDTTKPDVFWFPTSIEPQQIVSGISRSFVEKLQDISATNATYSDIPCEAVLIQEDPCFGEFCSNAGSCNVDENNQPICNCNEGYYLSENKLNCNSTPPLSNCRLEKCTATARTIPDNGDIESIVAVNRFQYPIEYVNIGINISHPDVSELEILLTSPNGTEVNLGNFTGENISFESKKITDFENELAVGDWVLRIKDTVPGNSGELHRWSLQIVPFYGED